MGTTSTITTSDAHNRLNYCAISVIYIIGKYVSRVLETPHIGNRAVLRLVSTGLERVGSGAEGLYFDVLIS